LLVELDVPVELVDVVEVEVVDVAARTQGVASRAVAITIPTIAASCAVLVFILSLRVTRVSGIYLISEIIP